MAGSFAVTDGADHVLERHCHTPMHFAPSIASSFTGRSRCRPPPSRRGLGPFRSDMLPAWRRSSMRRPREIASIFWVLRACPLCSCPSRASGVNGGIGSTRGRARAIDAICDDALPVPVKTPDRYGNALLTEVGALVHEAIRAGERRCAVSDVDDTAG